MESRESARPPCNEDRTTPAMIAEHFGYSVDELAPTRGFWKNDEGVLKKLSGVQEALEKFGDPKKKVRVIFDYDPGYPRALIQVWGLESDEAAGISRQGQPAGNTEEVRKSSDEDQ